MDIDNDDVFGTELHFAAQEGSLQRVQELVANGGDINAFDEIGKTPLHYAAESEHLEVASYLIEQGADVNAHHEPTIGNTPLREVAGSCSLRMARLLIDAGADPTVPGWMQLTALDKARERRKGEGPQVYELLVSAAKRPGCSS
jgi:ankyrin repeat protein